MNTAKKLQISPLGTSFTANNCTLVYLVDEAGARTTTDTFHDLYENNIADTLFRSELYDVCIACNGYNKTSQQNPPH